MDWKCISYIEEKDEILDKMILNDADVLGLLSITSLANALKSSELVLLKELSLQVCVL